MKTQSACTYWGNFGSMLGCRIQVGVGQTMLDLRWANTVSIALDNILRGVGLQTLARRWTNCIFSHRFGFKSCYWANIGPLLQTLRCILWLFKICWHAIVKPTVCQPYSFCSWSFHMLNIFCCWDNVGPISSLCFMNKISIHLKFLQMFRFFKKLTLHNINFIYSFSCQLAFIKIFASLLSFNFI